MTDETQKTVEIGDIEKLFSDSDEVTGEQLLNNQYVSDSNLALKTEIRDPVCLTVMRLFVKATEDTIYDNTSKLLDCAIDSFMEFMVSHKREGRKEFKDSWVALMETNMRKREGLADQLFGGSKR